MDRKELKEIAEQEMEQDLAEILLSFEERLCKIWETKNHCKNQPLRLICDYKITSRKRISLSTRIEVI